MMSQPNNFVVGLIAETASGTLQPVLAYNIPTDDETVISPSRVATKIGRRTGRKSKPGHTYLSSFSGSASFTTQLKGSGVETTKPQLNDLLQAGGFFYTGNDLTNTYLLDGTNPCSTLTYTATAYGCGTAPKGDTQHLIGAVPALTISSEGVGLPVVVGVEVTGGHIETTADNATLYDYSAQDTTSCLKLIGGTYTLGGVAVDIESFSISVNPTVAPVMDATNLVTNIAKHSITDLSGRQMTFSWKKPLLSTKDFSTEFKAETIYSTLVFQLLSADGGTGSITLTDVQVVEWGDEKGDTQINIGATLEFDTCTIDLDF